MRTDQRLSIIAQIEIMTEYVSAWNRSKGPLIAPYPILDSYPTLLLRNTALLDKL